MITEVFWEGALLQQWSMSWRFCVICWCIDTFSCWISYGISIMGWIAVYPVRPYHLVNLNVQLMMGHSCHLLSLDWALYFYYALIAYEGMFLNGKSFTGDMGFLQNLRILCYSTCIMARYFILNHHRYLKHYQLCWVIWLE